MKLHEIVDFLEGIAPFNYQEDYDNAGLITGSLDTEVKGIMVSLDATEAVIDDAIAHDCNVIVSHHPIIFRGLKKINGSNYVERTIIKAIKNDIALLAIHTNLDNVLENGVSQKIAHKIGLKDCKILVPKIHIDPSGKVGSGVIGTLSTEMSEQVLLQHIKTVMEASCIRHTELLGKSVKKIAVCGGSGSFLLASAKKQGADVFISADFKYHEFFDADQTTLIMDIGHYESEHFTIDLLFELFSNKFRNFALHFTKVNTNPIKYYQ